MRFEDQEKEVMYSDWTTEEIITTDDYWRYQGHLLSCVQRGLIKMLEGYDIDDCYFMDMKYSLQSLVNVKYSEVRLGKLVEETFSQFCKIGSPKDPNHESFEDEYTNRYDPESLAIITSEEKSHLRKLLDQETEEILERFKEDKVT